MANKGICCWPCGFAAAFRGGLCLGCQQQRRYDFHLVPTRPTKSFLYYRSGHQDARQLTHVGLVAAADGGEDPRANRDRQLEGTGHGFVVAVTDEG